MADKVAAGDKYEAAVAGPSGAAEAIRAPAFKGHFQCWEKDANGIPFVKWETPWENAVQNVGRAHIINRLFGSGTASTAGAGLFLHSATTRTDGVWSNISASQVISYGASIPAITFASTYTANSVSASASYGFTASTQTVSGAGVVFYTSASIGTDAASADMLLYAYGTFNASQLVQNGNTLSASVTLSYQSA